MPVPKMQPEVIILMGVSGSGKTEVGALLARKLGWTFYDGDDFHPPENVAKMEQGIPLDDSDRIPWLAALHDLIAGCLDRDQPAVLACSALKKIYRDRLLEGNHAAAIVYLHGDYSTILGRMQQRGGHFMKPIMLQSQFAALEEPDEALWVEIETPLEGIVDQITTAYRLSLAAQPRT